jgi:broad specificity phosphatase PhoE
MATVFLVRHAKAADRGTWTGPDRDRPLIDKGVRQARRLADALAREPIALVAASPWLRCVQTAEPLAAAARVQVSADDRLGYDRPDLAGWLTEAVAAHPGGGLVAVGHGDLIPDFLLDAGLLQGFPTFRTGSLFRLEVDGGRLGPVTYVDRAELR